MFMRKSEGITPQITNGWENYVFAKNPLQYFLPSTIDTIPNFFSKTYKVVDLLGLQVSYNLFCPPENLHRLWVNP